MLAVQDVRCCNVVQGVVLQGWGGRVKLGAEGQRVGGAVSGSGTDGADSLCGGLQRYRWTFVEAIFFSSEEEEKGADG